MTVRVICANTYGGKASVFSSCVDAIHLNLCVKVQKNLLYRDFRKEGRQVEIKTQTKRGARPII